MGLVLTRVLDVPLSRVGEEVLSCACSREGEMLHHGGPCEGPLMALHEDASAGDPMVTPGVYFTDERATIERLLLDPTIRCRMFVGYAGWGPGQLESELESGAWLVQKADSGFVFPSVPDYSRLLAGVTLGRFVDPSRIPDDPSVN